MNIPANPLEAIQRMLDNDLPLPIINQKAKEWELKIKIVEGRICDLSESTSAWLTRFITDDPRMKQAKEHITKLAPLEHPVLIHGPTGTGKEILAHALHGNREGKFIAVNCAAIPKELIESVLFGHVKGSFTGAAETTTGYMKSAESGTLFLDEIGEMTLAAQAKILRAMQERRIMRVGSSKEEEINCRFVCATNRDLSELSRGNAFREDLYARLGTFEVHSTPLAERIHDIIPIVQSLSGGPAFIKVCQDAAIPVTQIDTRFNVRSLQQHVLRYNVLGILPTI